MDDLETTTINVSCWNYTELVTDTLNFEFLPPPLLNNNNNSNENVFLPKFNYCGPGWTNFWTPYNLIHTRMATAICFLGCVTNIFNILVFSRPHMESPTNKILLALAVSDFLFVFSGLLLIPLELWFGGGEDCQNFGIVIMALVNEIMFILFHTWSCYLTLLLALWRLLGSMYPLHCKSWLTSKVSKFSIFISIILGIIFVTMMYSNFYLCAPNEETGIQWFEQSPLICNSVLGALVFDWIRAILIKILPCLLLTVTTMGLIGSLIRAESVRAKLRNPQPKSKRMDQLDCVESQEGKGPKQTKEFYRTNRMLVVVLLIFLITEIPPGILALTTALVGQTFYDECQSQIFRFTCFQEYISSTTSFFVYLAMSRKFRLCVQKGVAKFCPGWVGQRLQNLSSVLTNSSNRTASSTLSDLNKVQEAESTI